MSLRRRTCSESKTATNLRSRSGSTRNSMNCGSCCSMSETIRNCSCFCSTSCASFPRSCSTDYGSCSTNSTVSGSCCRTIRNCSCFCSTSCASFPRSCCQDCDNCRTNPTVYGNFRSLSCSSRARNCSKCPCGRSPTANLCAKSFRCDRKKTLSSTTFRYGRTRSLCPYGSGSIRCRWDGRCIRGVPGGRDRDRGRDDAASNSDRSAANSAGRNAASSGAHNADPTSPSPSSNRSSSSNRGGSSSSTGWCRRVSQ